MRKPTLLFAALALGATLVALDTPILPVLKTAMTRDEHEGYYLVPTNQLLRLGEGQPRSPADPSTWSSIAPGASWRC